MTYPKYVLIKGIIEKNKSYRRKVYNIIYFNLVLVYQKSPNSFLRNVIKPLFFFFFFNTVFLL